MRVPEGETRNQGVRATAKVENLLKTRFLGQNTHPSRAGPARHTGGEGSVRPGRQPGSTAQLAGPSVNMLETWSKSAIFSGNATYQIT